MAGIVDKQLAQGDVLVVAAVDRIGRRRMDTISILRDLRSRGVRLRSLAEQEQTWTRYLDADPESPEANDGDILTSFFSWQADLSYGTSAAGHGPGWPGPGRTGSASDPRYP